MKSNERLYKGYRQITEGLNSAKVFVMADSTDFQKPGIISLEVIGNVLQLKLDQDITSKNVAAVDSLNLASSPDSSPDNFSISQKTHISVDENYLYIWIPKIGKWKRIPLSDWTQE